MVTRSSATWSRCCRTQTAAPAAQPAAGKIGFMFPGQGSQYPHMGRDLVCCFPSALQAVLDADQHFDQNKALWEFLFPRPAHDDDQRHQQADAIRRTDVAQPTIGAVSLAMPLRGSRLSGPSGVSRFRFTPAAMWGGGRSLW